MSGSVVSTRPRWESDRFIPPPGTFEIDPVHTSVIFRAQHLVIGRVQGRFDMVTGSLTIAENVLDSHVEVSIDAGSIATRMPIRDDRLHSYEFFEVANYPNLTFRSTGTTESHSGEWSINGDLTIRGVTVTTKLIVAFCGAVSDPFANLRVGFQAAATIRRRHLGPLLNLEKHSGNLPVASDVTIEIDAEAVHPSGPTGSPSIPSLRGDDRKGRRSIPS
jgi:polyisoprenoid-binding protein YceI